MQIQVGKRGESLKANILPGVDAKLIRRKVLAKIKSDYVLKTFIIIKDKVLYD